MATASKRPPTVSGTGIVDRDLGLLDAVLDATSEAILVVDGSGDISQFNHRFCEMWKVPKEALQGGSTIQVCESMVRQVVDSEAAKNRLVTLMDSSVSVGAETITFSDGRTIEYRWSPQTTGETAAGGVLTFRDVTEARKARNLLSDEVWVNAGLARIRRQLGWSADTSVMLHRLCEATTEVLECDASHTYLWSPEESAFVLVAGHGDTQEQWQLLQTIRPSHDMVGDLLSDFENDEIAEVSIGQSTVELADGIREHLGVERTIFMALRRGDETIGFHTACIRASGRSFEDRQRRLARGTGQLVSLALENARLVQELARANRRKEEFVTALSHGLRSPLHVILGYTSLLLEEDRELQGDEPRDIVRRIDRSGRQLADMLEGTLAADITSEVDDVELAHVALADLLRDVEIETREIRDEAGLAYAWDISPGLPTLHSDGEKIKIILKNLISNAVKFTEVGGIFVSAVPENTGVQITVTDTGIGIGPEAQKIIFEPFRQIEGVSGETHGTGLGLHVARRMLEILGGKIEVESSPGEGATFRVWLPAPGLA